MERRFSRPPCAASAWEAGLRPDLAERSTGFGGSITGASQTTDRSIHHVSRRLHVAPPDLVSLRAQAHEMNGESHTDGHKENCKLELGPSSPPPTGHHRKRDRRRAFAAATLFIALGTPMMLAGDESCRNARVATPTRTARIRKILGRLERAALQHGRK